RLGKTLRTEDVDGEKVTVTGAWDSEEEARAIGEEIEELQRAKENLNEIAILVRASFQMREFEDRFVTLGLPYRVIGGPRFYERAEIRDALAYLRTINSPSDDLAFERIINTPKRGLGDAGPGNRMVVSRDIDPRLGKEHLVRVLVEQLRLRLDSGVNLAINQHLPCIRAGVHA
ncbi:hypothetical protein KXW38_001170, partial [Aspergillus fumigatus]